MHDVVVMTGNQRTQRGDVGAEDGPGCARPQIQALSPGQFAPPHNVREPCGVRLAGAREVHVVPQAVLLAGEPE
jgi:hypothetical protein